MSLALNKNTIPSLMESQASFLVVDFFDFCQPVAGYQYTTFSTYDYTFYNTKIYRENRNKFVVVDFMALHPSLWYGYVDLYWQKMKSKFKNNIILVRLNCSSQFVTKEKTVKQIPQNLLAFGNAKYNRGLRELEDYIIGRYKPYVIDVSKFFLPDESYNPDTTPVHFEENYNLLTSCLYKSIMQNKTQRKYYDSMPPYMVAELLSRPVNDEDFEKIYEGTELPFSSDCFLDDICKQFKMADIVSNRSWLSKIYQRYSTVIKNKHSQSEQDPKAITDFISDTLDAIPSSSNIFIQSFIEKLKVQLTYFQAPVQKLYSDFLKAFDTANLSWIDMLKTLSYRLPDDKKIEYYMLQYYIATNDKTNIQKLKLNYGIVD